MTEDAHRPVAAQVPAKAIPMQTAWNEARALVGGPLLWASLHYASAGQPIDIGIVLKAAPHGDARNYVYIDPHTGKVLEFRPYGTLNAGSKIYYWALALHTGHVGGVAVHVIMLVGMIGVTLIGYAGIDSFLRKSLRRRRKPARDVQLRESFLLER